VGARTQGDVDPMADPVLYWFQSSATRTRLFRGFPTWWTRNPAVGTQVAAHDLNGTASPISSWETSAGVCVPEPEAVIWDAGVLAASEMRPRTAALQGDSRSCPATAGR